MDTNKELIPKIAELYERYTNSHLTDAVKKLREHTINFGSLDIVYDIFNKYIGWGGTKEGHTYYYFLNLKWAMEITYLCHEFSKDYDNYCLGKLEYYYGFSDRRIGSYSKKSKYTREQCIALYDCYTRKIKKMREIFGNIKN